MKFIYLKFDKFRNDWVSGDDPFKDGVFDFVAYRHLIETYNGTFTADWALICFLLFYLDNYIEYNLHFVI